MLAPEWAGAIEPFKRQGSPHFKLSLVGYSLRKYFNEKNPANRITLFDFIDYCADHGVSAAELTGYYFPKPVTNEYLFKLKRYLHLRGISISGTSLGNNFAQPKGPKLDEQVDAVKKWVDVAAIIGAPYVRVFSGSTKGMPLEEEQKNCIASLEECAEYAGTKGIFLGLENDAGITPDAKSVLELVAGVKSPWFGLNLDLGNFHTADVYGDVAKCAPYAINVHVKAEVREKGKNIGEPADIGRMVKILRDAGYQGYLALEYEAAEDPYKVIPDWIKRVREQIEG